MTGVKRQSRIRILQLILVFLLLFLLIFILGTESARVAAEVGTETVCEETVTHVLTSEGVLFREETSVRDLNSGPVYYLKANGEAVLAGEALADVYRDDTGTGKRARAAALYAELELLQAALTEEDEAWQLTYLRAYGALAEKASRGDLAGGDEAEQALTVALLRKEAATGNTAALEARMDALEAELAAMVQYVGAPDVVFAETSGVFYREVDGYESVFTPAAIEGLTPEGLSRLLSCPPDEPEGLPQAVGKVASGGAFALAVPATATEALFFSVGENYAVTFEDSALTLQMRLTALTPAKEGEDVLLCFSAEACPAFADAARMCRVQIKGESVTGLSVPETAMRAENNRDGVYILQNGAATWRPVKILYRANGCCLVAPGDAMENGSEERVLAAGDLLVVTERRIYEGKALNG